MARLPVDGFLVMEVTFSSDLLRAYDESTGEIFFFEQKGNTYRIHKTQQDFRAERYALKSVVNNLYPKSRTAKCSRMTIPHHQVEVLKAKDYNKAFYSGLVRCGSVWWCPLCASKIAERRRVELVAATTVAKAMGMSVYLVTATIPHGLGDDVKLMLNKMLKAWRKMTDDRQGKKVRESLSLVGTIRALEVTDGQNGFHPHFHALYFIESPSVSKTQIQDSLLSLWQNVCIKVGLPRPSDLHGLRVDDGDYLANYVTKWGLESELVKGHLKKSRSGMSPWDLLRDILENDSKRSVGRFKLYADAFKGRRQLYWSNGLKKLLSISEVSDEELAVLEEERATRLCEITLEQWRIILAKRLESSVLDIAENNPDKLTIFLNSITF